MSNEAKLLSFPDTLANWPWKRAINPYYEEVKAESDAWFRNFKAFSPRSQYAFEKCNFEELRAGCDLMNLLFAIDEYTDVDSEVAVREIVDIVIDALKNPRKSRPEGEMPLGEVTRQFWERTIKIATLSAQRHMIDGFIYYTEEVVRQAAYRDNNTQLTIESYLENRRGNIGSVPSYVPMELDLDLPDEVFYHPAVVSLTVNITDLMIFDNDIYSYNKEQAVGDDHSNIISVAMHEFNIDLESAISKVVQLHAQTVKDFLDGLKKLPSWGPTIDSQVQTYLHRVASWVRANDCWTFECGRYFGNKGLEIQKTRVVQLLPKIAPPRQDKSLRRENVAVPLVEALEVGA
ncbi:terpenoid synthase [Fomitiporia mediterranea MF3/22]|uniref:terpenoid synthase n=1 Tax=Fomitiporia mediterranea (strain MF3/22) TaxID=694068 RepID=UPI0004407E09|nr:terpenoid synthase [Fomitiporia mediterranea MF3/22]EJD04757.1 terpenoid synthase [Fomitiporia mediterranea MF3/22]